MWNVKRVLILIAGAIACIICFAIYTLFLGNIDAVPPLGPDQLAGADGEIGELDPVEADKRLAQSFGANCKELQWPLRLWLSDKGVVFAAGDFSIEKDGKVKLAPFSAAIYHKSKTLNAYPEISTIRAAVAILTLDRPVASYTELNTRKVIGVEMIGKAPGITLTNNRRTAEKNDDVDILISNVSVSRLFYEERKNLIWTDDVVCLKDFQAQPPTEVRGKGFEMHLAKETNPNKPRVSAKVQAAPATNDNGNIEKIVLHSDVDMHFWVDASAGFLGGEPNTKKAAPLPIAGPGVARNKGPDKAHIHIRTGGSFVYELNKEFAWFESPLRDADAAKPDIGPLDDRVHVVRLQLVNGKENFDQLFCDRLDLQFRKRFGPAPNGNPTMGGDKEIETATATRHGKDEIILSLDSEGMAAYGSEMFYRAGDLHKGPMTILKGEPLKSFKSGHKMVSKDLHLFGANRAGDGQRAFAQGPLQIDFLDEKSPQKDPPPYNTHVICDKDLEVIKDKEGGEVFDLIIVRGNAVFLDDLQKQDLHGDTIKVWIKQVQESAKKPEATGGPRQELHRVVADTRVHATSPEFIIRQADWFTVTFLNKTAAAARLPEPANATAQPSLPPASKGPPDPTPKKAPVEDKKKPDPPIELTGNKITAEVFTLNGKKELQELVANGNVHVFQPGEKLGEKRIDITGQLLTIKYAEKGHIMVVHGDQKNLARLEFGDSILWGPLVNLDRGKNTLEVFGDGAMEMPSNKNLDGTDTPKDQKATRVRIYWKKNMDFDGRNAFFRGGVQALQHNAPSRMQCENLQAILDKFVSFKEGENQNRSAKLDRLICDKNVFIDDSAIDEKKQLVQRNQFFGKDMTTDNTEGGTNLGGPGKVKILARGNSNLAVGPQPLAADSKSPPKLDWKLTHVNFTTRMWAPKTPNGTRSATFYGDGGGQGVEVFHFLTTNIDATMNADRPPLDSLYLRCGVLKVEGRQSGERTTQFMKAQYNVEFRTDKYLGLADIVTYNEETEIVILESEKGGLVRLYEFRPDDPTPHPMSIKSTKVLYNRKTGVMESAGVKSISN